MGHLAYRYKKASFWTVLAGKHDLDNANEGGQQVPAGQVWSCSVQHLTRRFLSGHLQMVGVSNIITHQQYNTRTKENDLALLKLEKSLVFNDQVRPINIWMAPLAPSKTCTITGWGATQESE